MSAVSAALSSLAAQQVQTQDKLAAVFAKQQARADASLVSLIEEGAKNIEQISSTPPPGLGKVVNVSA